MMSTQALQAIDSFLNSHPDRDYDIRMRMPEFTCLCPKTGQPDFASLRLLYVPDRLCVELKSLKQYLWSFRDRGAFHERVTNEIADHLFDTLRPRYLKLGARFNVRGGIFTSIIVTRVQDGWTRRNSPV